MWDPPRPGIEPVSPALAGGFLNTEPQGSPVPCIFKKYFITDIYFVKVILLYLFIFWVHWVFVPHTSFLCSCGERGLLFIAVRRLLIAVASLVAEHRL